MPSSLGGQVLFNESSKSLITNESLPIFETLVNDKVQEEEKKEGDVDPADEVFNLYPDHQRPQSDSMSVLRFIKGRKCKKYELSPSGKFECFIIRIKLLAHRALHIF